MRQRCGWVLLEEITEACQCALGGEGPSQVNGGLFTDDIYPLRWRVFRLCFGGSAISTRPMPSVAFHVTVLTVSHHRSTGKGRKAGQQRTTFARLSLFSGSDAFPRGCQAALPMPLLGQSRLSQARHEARDQACLPAKKER